MFAHISRQSLSTTPYPPQYMEEESNIPTLTFYLCFICVWVETIKTCLYVGGQYEAIATFVLLMRVNKTTVSEIMSTLISLFFNLQ